MSESRWIPLESNPEVSPCTTRKSLNPIDLGYAGIQCGTIFIYLRVLQVNRAVRSMPCG